MKRARPETIQLWGGTLCLDLANTVDRAEDGGHVAPELTDVLTGPDLIARWGVHVGVFAPPASAVVSRAELERVRALREALHDTFAAIAGGAALIATLDFRLVLAAMAVLLVAATVPLLTPPGHGGRTSAVDVRPASPGRATAQTRRGP